MRFACLSGLQNECKKKSKSLAKETPWSFFFFCRVVDDISNKINIKSRYRFSQVVRSAVHLLVSE